MDRPGLKAWWARQAARVDKAAADGSHDNLFLWISVAACVAVGAVAWFIGVSMLRDGGHDTEGWNRIWALTGISFLFAFVPLPGVTTALMLYFRNDWRMASWAILGATVASVVAASLMLVLGRVGRRILEKKATHGKWRQKLLAFSQKAATKWTYGAILVLLIPQFIPRAVVLYTAVVARLRTTPFLAAVAVGVALRNLVMMYGYSFIPAGWFAGF